MRRARKHRAAARVKGSEMNAADAERAVLAAMLLDPESVGAAIEQLTTGGVFYRVAHGKIFKAIAAMFRRNEKADLVTVTEELRRRGELEAVGGTAALAQLLEYATSSTNLRQHAALVLEAARKRRLAHLGVELQEMADDPTRTADEVLGHLQGGLARVNASATNVNRFVESSLSGPAILDYAFPRPPSLLGAGIVSAGDLMVMFGEAGTYKTWLAILLALGMASGTPWMGLPTTQEPVPVGFIELELHGHSVQDRLRALGGHVPPTFHLIVRPLLRGPVDFVDADGAPRHLRELRGWIERHGLKAVFIDALARATSCPQVDFSPLLLQLDVLRAETGCMIGLLHHENARGRSNGGEPAPDMDFMRGDSRLRGFPQAILRVLEHGGAHCVRFAKVSCAGTPEPIYFRPDENGVPQVIAAPDEAQRARGAAVREAILRFVLDAGRPVSRGEVEVAVGRGRSAVTEHLRVLLEAGRIDAHGENKGTRYMLPTGATGSNEAAGANGHAR